MATGLYSGASGLAIASGLYRGSTGLYGGYSGLIRGVGPDNLYWILLNGVYVGAFDVTTASAGSLGTASSNMPGTLVWGVGSGSDARISVDSSTGEVSTSSGIPLGDSALFELTVSNGTITIGVPFEAVGTIAASFHVTLEDGTGSLLLESGDYLLLESA